MQLSAEDPTIYDPLHFSPIVGPPDCRCLEPCSIDYWREYRAERWDPVVWTGESVKGYIYEMYTSDPHLMGTFCKVTDWFIMSNAVRLETFPEEIWDVRLYEHSPTVKAISEWHGAARVLISPYQIPPIPVPRYTRDLCTYISCCHQAAQIIVGDQSRSKSSVDSLLRRLSMSLNSDSLYSFNVKKTVEGYISRIEADSEFYAQGITDLLTSLLGLGPRFSYQMNDVVEPIITGPDGIPWPAFLLE